MKTFSILFAIVCAVAVRVDAATNTWVRKEGADPKASNPANWSLKRVPKAGDVVLFSRRNIRPAVWDENAPHKVAGWIQEEGYFGVVTIETSPRGSFQTLEVKGDFQVLGGAVTHHQNESEEKWWLQIKAGGDIVVGSNAVISASAKGFAPGKGPSPGVERGFGASHGGQGAPRNGAEIRDPAKTCGFPLNPRSSGSGGCVREGTEGGPHGGGVIRLEAEGNIVLLGNAGIRADADKQQWGGANIGGAAGGSIRLVAGKNVRIETGNITADGGPAFAEGGGGGGGGRIAIEVGGTESPVIWFYDNWALASRVHADGGVGDTRSRGDTNVDRHIRGAGGTLYLLSNRGEARPGTGDLVVFNNQRTTLSSTRLPVDMDPNSREELRAVSLIMAHGAFVSATDSFSVREVGFKSSGSIDLNSCSLTTSAVWKENRRNNRVSDAGTHRANDIPELDAVVFNGGRVEIAPYFEAQ